MQCAQLRSRVPHDSMWEDVSAQNGLHKQRRGHHLIGQIESPKEGDGDKHYKLSHTEETV